MKKGFTLAEILITLGIIGVVAALTAPSLVQNAGNAKVGPTLQKTVSTIEIANQQMLVDEEAEKLSAALGLTSTNTTSSDTEQSNFKAWANKISEKISGSSVSTTFAPTTAGYGTENKTAANFSTGGNACLHLPGGVDAFGFSTTNSYTKKGSYLGSFMRLFFVLDINGQNNKPNQFGKDLFAFVLDENGKLTPVSGKTYKYLTGTTNTWESYCNSSGVSAPSAGATKGVHCAGSIFDNNLKIIYK